MSFSPAHLTRQLQSLAVTQNCWVAYSGGVDSHVLLHALVLVSHDLNCQPGAVHVNHALQPEADAWEAHCRGICEALDVPFVALPVNAHAGRGESPEAAARAARYRALAAWLPEGHSLLTAQHQDDQAETLLLQLLRGSGVRGLAAMPGRTAFGHGHLLRPLLDCSRHALLEYAREQGLQWVDDPSNEDTALDRNFLRLQVLPQLRARWPACSATLARSARHCAEAAQIMERLAQQDVSRHADTASATLSINGILGLTADRQRNALRHWLQGQCATVPSSAVLERIIHDVLASRADAGPCVRWGRFEIRRYRERLYLLPQRSPGPPAQPLAWELSGPLELPDAGGLLAARRSDGQGISLQAIGHGGVLVGYRQGGERCRPVGRQHHHSLKKLFQEAGVPPWQRTRVPLIYIDGELAAVAGFWVCEPFAARPGEPGLTIVWRGAGASCKITPDRPAGGGNN